MITAVILRTYNLPKIPFTHDEFSALFRTHFASITELIEKGIKIDGHPAGVQVFLYYYTKIFGESEVVVKLPFILCGLLSVLFTYLLGKHWFNSTTALISSAYVATLQYTVMYSQIARPYSSGLLFALAMVWFWDKILFNPQGFFLKNSTGYIIASALCAYNHHFGLLLAGIVGATGMLFIRRENLLRYIICVLLIITLYLPHLPVFFSQLKSGGVEEWLSKPDWRFIIEYMKYIFHFSPYVISLLIVVLVIPRMHYNYAKPTKYFYLSLAWFALPFLIGYYYSVYISAVLQYSVLLFSFPFLLFTLLSFVPTLSFRYNALFIVAIITVNILSMIYERQHYTLFYNSPYRELIRDSQKSTLAFPGCEILLNTHENITNFYIGKNKIQLVYHKINEFKGKPEMMNFLSTDKASHIAYGSLSSGPVENYQLIREYFPQLIVHNCYFNADFYVFSKDNKATVHELNEYLFKSVNGYDSLTKSWSQGSPSNYCDTFGLRGKTSYVFKEKDEFGTSFTHPLKSMIGSKNDFIDISVNVFSEDTFCNAILVATLEESDGETIYWSGGQINDFHVKGKWFKAFHTVKLSDITLRYNEIILKIYLWNNKSSFFADDFTVKVRKGNPILYGMFEKIE